MTSLENLIPAGKKFISAGRTISEGDFTMLTNLTWTTDRIHSDREYMQQTPFGERILAGACVLACAIGLANRSGIAEVIDNDRVKRIAALGLEAVKFTAPVKPGDTITVHSEIMDVRPTSKDPKRAVIRIKETTFNQTGHEVMTYIRSILLEKVV